MPNYIAPSKKEPAMIFFRFSFLVVMLFTSVCLAHISSAWAFVDEPGKQTSFYTPVIRVVPDKGFVLINSGNGVLWVKASQAAMPHLSKLPVGGLVDLVVEFQGKPNPPIIQSWKLASGNSACDVFDGTNCIQPEKHK